MKLLEHFKELSLHPKNAEKLKGLILQLAVQGKLTAKWREAHPKVEPASELLKRIEAEKQQLIAEKKIRKEKPLPLIEYDEIPYELPEGWIWCRMSEIGIINPRNTLADDLDIGFVPMKSISQNYSVPPEFEVRKWKDVKRNFTHFRNNDVAFAKITPCFENSKACVFSDLPNGYGAGTTELHVFRKINNDIYPSFIYSVFKSPHFLEQGEGKMTGTAGQKRVPKNYFSEYVVGVPPVEEQKAIVEVVNTLFAEVEQLESLSKERIQLKESFVVSALTKLTEAENTQQEWNFLQQHFSSFLTEKKNIKSLRETILQLAVQGKLTEGWRANNPNIEPASELLKRIQAEKQKLIAEKKIKKEKPLPPIGEDEMPYELPEGWVWCRLIDISSITGGFAFKSGNYVDEGVRVIRISDFDEHGFKNHKVVRHVYTDELFQYVLEDRNILIAMTGGTVGKSLFVNHVNETMVVNQRVATIKIIQPIFEAYVNCVIPTRLIQDVIEEAKNSTNDNISMSDIKGFNIPLPTLEEQKAIVEKVNSLMALCDELEQQIESSHSQVEQLMQSCLQEVFEY